jgi:phenylalanyl-tRNA synthetase beta chain
MIVSWKWLQDYVRLEISADEFARRLMMAGLNHESTEPVGDDLAIDLEVTSNRPDCLGHIGIAREAAVLWGLPLAIPQAIPPAAKTPASELTKVSITAGALCPRYTARVIRGVRVAPSPAWMVERLKTIGVTPINNVVDVTNYVLFECGQPLHAFDFQKLGGHEIVVREPSGGEKIEAIDHKTYELAPGMCVIADGQRPVAIGGVMGGAATEVTAATRDLLIEAAIFDPASIRATARKLNLHSDSSYRFERGVDPQGVDWASRRCCELILQVAGGELCAGSVDVGEKPAARAPVVLRLSQLKRVLGIEIPPERSRAILAALGNEIRRADAQTIEVIPPSWRRDLSREIDLVEEVARIHGYEAIPEDVQVPMAPSARTAFDRVLGRVRHALTGMGFDEAYTLSVVEQDWSEAFSPWTEAAPLTSATPVLRRADRLRRSLVPSLLGARRANEALANRECELFEIARVYLPRQEALPEERWMIALAGGGDFVALKGAIQALLRELHAAGELSAEPYEHPLFERGRGARLSLGGERLGYLGQLSAAGRKQFELRSETSVAEIDVQTLIDRAQLVPQYRPPIPYPPIDRDINLVVPELVRWADVAATVRSAAGPILEELAYRETYRDAERLGPGKKSLLFSITLRDPAGTLTSERADAVRTQIVAACRRELGGELRE